MADSIQRAPLNQSNRARVGTRMNQPELHIDMVCASTRQAGMPGPKGYDSSARQRRIQTARGLARLACGNSWKKWRMPLVLWMSVLLLAAPRGFASGPLVSRGQAANHGLHRAWFAQIGIDSGRHRTQGWLLYQDRIYVATTAGTVHALDAGTGEAIWSVRVGRSDVPTLGPAASDRHLAVVSGSTLVLLDRHDGNIVWSRRAGSAPSASPAVSSSRVYVALLSGRVEAYQIDAPDGPAWFSQSAGRPFMSPTVTSQSVSWSTDRGYLYVSQPEPPNLMYRVEFNGNIIAAPTELKTFLLIGSMDNNLYCIDQSNGGEQWRYATGCPMVNRPSAIEDRVYVTTQEQMLHALEAATGVLLWKSADISRFVAQGKARIYGLDRHGDLVVLDPKTGGRLGHMRLAGSLWGGRGPIALSNDQSDRIYLINDHGLVQCFHEIGLTEPIRYRQPVEQEGAEAESEQAEQEGAAATDRLKQPSTQDVTEPAPDDKNPLAEPQKAPPADTPPADTPTKEDPFEDLDNPFGE
jgi:outer membrane protein assembly factor BamB